MKIKVKEKPLAEVLALPRPPHKNPPKPLAPLRPLVRLLAKGDMKACHVTWKSVGMDKLGKEPALILMNHSSFLDLEMASHIFADRPYHIVTTFDGFIGKSGLMYGLGCIPTRKFVTDLQLVRDIRYALQKNRCSVLMYPEASYTFDGTATPLPESVGKLVKLLSAPVVTVITHGSFARDPLYNGLQKRQVEASAEVTYFLSPEEIKTMTPAEIQQRLEGVFTFDGFRWQQENRIRIPEPFRADGLNRVLYKCPHCLTEGQMEGKGIHLICKACGKQYTLDEYGSLQAEDARFTHVPDWYAWERECVRRELEEGSYRLEVPVDILAAVDFKAVYRVGSGRLTHDSSGFLLEGCDGALRYTRSPKACYGLYADYFWYELGDMLCIGDNETSYYCFPTNGADLVAKTRLAVEELYKMQSDF